MSHRPLSARAVALALGVGVALSACGSSPTDTPDTDVAVGDSASGMEAVYEAVDGLEGQERFDKLVELAEEAGGECGYYHSGNMEKDVMAFQEASGLTIQDFQSTSERMAERVSNEHQANATGSSVVLGSDSNIIELNRQGMLETLDTPVMDLVEDNLKGENWLSPIVIMEMPTYNTNALKPEDAPATWEEFFTEYDGRKAIEITDWSWFMTMVQDYFMEQKGMTEEEAIAMFTEAFRGASTVDGHTLAVNLLASGQYDYLPNAFAHYVPGLVEKGAPITYDNLSEDMPPSAITLAMGVTANAPNPACGLAFLEWTMSAEGQEMVASKDYVPTASTYEGESLLEQYPNALLEVSPDPAVQAEWEAKFDTFLREAGTQAPVSE